MADYTNSKGLIGAVYPELATDTAYERLEPIIGYDEIRTRHLFGLSLESQMLDPITKKRMVMTEDMVKDIIDGAVNQAEIECQIDISPVKHRFKMPFDRNLYQQYGYFVVPFRPVTGVDKVAVTPANGLDVYEVPLEWVETAYAIRGQINIIPMTAAFIQGGNVPSNPVGGAFFLAVLNNRGWVPAYWLLDITSGYPDGLVPRIINELIGTIAAQEILSQLAATYARSQSHSLSIDGLSQSVSTPGPQIFKNRFDELETKKERLVGKIKGIYGRKIFASST